MSEEEPLFRVIGAGLLAGVKRTYLLESPFVLSHQLKYAHERRRGAETLFQHSSL